MRWILAGLLLVSLPVFAVPDEILSGYLERYEMCVKDAMIRAPSSTSFEILKQNCKINYINMIERSPISHKIVNDNSIPVQKWKKFLADVKNLPEFTVKTERDYIFFKRKAVLKEFYIKRDPNYKTRFVLWKNHRKVEYKTIPMSEALNNAQYIDGKISVMGLDSNIPYYVVQKADSYYMKTEYGHSLTLEAAIYLADRVLIVYDNVPLGIVSKEVIEEID